MVDSGRLTLGQALESQGSGVQAAPYAGNSSRIDGRLRTSLDSFVPGVPGEFAFVPGTAGDRFIQW